VYVISVTVFVKPENVQQFIEASFDNARGSRTEPGCLRWDLSQAEDDKTRFLLHEVYKTKDDFVKHQQQPHYFKWRDAVAPWMAQPRQPVKLFSLYPPDDKY
jgi:(4S)-4-hydroxy-5-phosphonooxypentane-2,3-dione isomerase